MKDILISLVSFTASLTSVASLVPQIVRSYKTKSVGDLSMLMIINLVVCSISWTIYGVLIGVESIWATNLVMTFFAIVLLRLKIKYAKKTVLHAINSAIQSVKNKLH